MGSGWFGLVLGLMGIGVGMAFIDAPVAALLAGTLWTGKGSGTVFNSRLMSSIAFFSPLCSPFFFLLFPFFFFPFFFFFFFFTSLSEDSDTDETSIMTWSPLDSDDVPNSTNWFL